MGGRILPKSSPLWRDLAQCPSKPKYLPTMTQIPKTPPQYRMTIEDVYRDFRDGLLTVKGAVYCAIAATCKFGDPVQFNVSYFLERTGIHPRSYSRAVATWIEEKRLDFPPNAIQTLRVPVLSGTREPLHYSLTTSSGQICDREGQICPEEGQICDRKGSICPEEGSFCPDRPPESPLCADSRDSSTSLSSLFFSLSSGEREEDAVPDEYEEWLTKRALELPTPPTLIQEWIEKNKNKKSNRKQFLKYKEQLKRASVPQPAEAAIFEVETMPAPPSRITLLRGAWAAGRKERERAIASVLANPQWGIAVTDEGFVAVEGEL